MIFKTLAVAAMSLGLATGAFAQTTGTGADSGSAGGANTTDGGQSNRPMQNWDGPINDAFYGTDGALRSQADIHAQWSKLDATQQDKVRADCKAADTSNAEMTKACDMVKGM